MIEALEALKRIKREAGTPCFSTLYDIDTWRDDFALIEKALKDYERMRQIKYTVVEGRRYDVSECGDKALFNELKPIKVEIYNEETEKKLKALEIIKRYISVKKGFYDQCWIVIGDYSINISKEKYDVLKEALKNE